jgi:hypothetical protein
MSSIITTFIGLQRKERETSLNHFNHYGGTKMKSLKIALVALMLTGFFGTQAKAQNQTVDGIIIGTAVAGIVGLIVASEMDTHSHGREYVYHRYGREHVYHSYGTKRVYRKTVVHSPPPPPRYYRNRDNSRHDFRPGKYHHNISTGRDQRGHSRQIVEKNHRDRR